MDPTTVLTRTFLAAFPTSTLNICTMQSPTNRFPTSYMANSQVWNFFSRKCFFYKKTVPDPYIKYYLPHDKPLPCRVQQSELDLLQQSGYSISSLRLDEAPMVNGIQSCFSPQKKPLFFNRTVAVFFKIYVGYHAWMYSKQTKRLCKRSLSELFRNNMFFNVDSLDWNGSTNCLDFNENRFNNGNDACFGKSS